MSSRIRSLAENQVDRGNRLRGIVQIITAKKRCKPSPRGAANLLGMRRTTLQARMRKLGIRRPV